MTEKTITTFEGITKIVSMIDFKGLILVATEYQVFQIVNDQLIPLKIKYEEGEGRLEKNILPTEKPIESLELTVRSTNGLCAANINTIEKLMNCKVIELYRTPNLGRKSISEIIWCLAYSLGYEVDPSFSPYARFYCYEGTFKDLLDNKFSKKNKDKK